MLCVRHVENGNFRTNAPLTCSCFFFNGLYLSLDVFICPLSLSLAAQLRAVVPYGRTFLTLMVMHVHMVVLLEKRSALEFGTYKPLSWR